MFICFTEYVYLILKKSDKKRFKYLHILPRLAPLGVEL